MSSQITGGIENVDEEDSLTSSNNSRNESMEEDGENSSNNKVKAENELLLLGVDEPTSYSEAIIEPAWEQAMKDEVDSIERNKTWNLVELPPGHKEVFAPVTRLETVRLLLALAGKNCREVHYLDVKSMFLNGELQETVFVTQPEGFVKKGKEKLVYKLVKALYGLRQAPRAWYAKLRTNTSIIRKFKKQMREEFDMSDLGKLSYYLGIKVDQNRNYIELKQSAYAKKLLEKAGMLEWNPAKYPMEPKL
ncbi:hypothetical protein AgCh_023640 [Apium graveolens]